jgi:hypothetical protein
VATHLGARAVQAGALLALVGGMLAAASSAALAQAPNISVNISSRDLPSGGTTTLRYTITNTNSPGTTTQANVSVRGLQCTGDCTPVAQIPPGLSRDFTAQVTAPQVGAGQTQTIQLQVSAQIGNDNGNQQVAITVHGADKPQTIRQVTGRVKDQDGKPLPGATVGLRDSQGHTQSTTSNNDGRFQFTSTDAQPILTGSFSVGAAKEGYQGEPLTLQGEADKTINVPLTLRLIAATTSATPSVSAPPSPAAADAATDQATDQASLPPAPDTQNAAQSGGSGSLLFIILGALLVAAGVGAIVLVVMRRKNAGEDPSDPDGSPGPGRVMPTNRLGGPDPTRVAAPVGGRLNDATMLAGRSVPSVADAPTMMQQAVPIEDEFPDPYGAPAVPQPGYAGAGGYTAGGYGGASQYGGGAYGGAAVPAPSGSYDAGPPTQYGRPPVQDEDPYAAGYGAPPAAGPQRYDEPTGMYRPEADSGYGGGREPGYSAGAYQGADGGYGREPEYPPPAPRGRGETAGPYQGGGNPGAGYAPEPQQQPDQGGYGSWGAPAGGIDSGNAYGPPAGGNYGAPAGSGAYGGASNYGAPTSSGSYGRPDAEYDDQADYDPRATYGRPDSYDRGQPEPRPSYGAADQGGAYGGEQYGGDQAPAAGGYYGGNADQSGGGRHGGHSRQQPQDPTDQGRRRPLDWLDD